jgi:hypothetical protein
MSRDQPGDEDLVEDGEDVGNGDIIARSKGALDPPNLVGVL